MKHIILTILLSLAFLPLKAQSDTIEYKQRKNVIEIESNMLPSSHISETERLHSNPGYIHIKNAGTYHRKAYAFELTFIPLSIASGCMIGYGHAKEKSNLKVMGYVAGGLAVVDAIAAVTFHFKTGKELQLSADHIKFKF